LPELCRKENFVRDVFVSLYRGEGFGMPLLETMACGKPAMATT
jgi:glycosyltransferase involved in cell wall biosynthesis